MESSSQDRHLPATQRKLDQARRDGQVARSKDLSHVAVVGTGAVTLLLLAPSAFDYLRALLAQTLAFNLSNLSHPEDMATRLAHLAGAGLVICVLFSAVVVSAAIASAIAAGGWVASSKSIGPDLKRLSPLSGLGNLFSKQQLANVAKLVAMSALLGTVGWSFVASSMDEALRLALQSSSTALRALGDWLVSGMSLMLLVLVGAAVVDVPLQNFFHRAKLRMSHHEVRQEQKEADGNPQMKGRQRDAAREISQRASITAVPRADFVLMNPTHFAVALRYDDKTMSAPQVISKGADLLAIKIREIATDHSIPVVQSPTLARALFAHAEIDQPIPSTLFAAVAQVLAYVYRLKAALRGEGPIPQAAPQPHVPPELDPLNQRSAARGATA